MRGISNRLLIVDDEASIRDYLCTVGEQLGFQVRAIAAAEELAAELKDFGPTALILDLNMPGSDGIELLRYLAKEKSDAQILVISGEDVRVLNAAERLGCSQGLRMAGALQKPVLLNDLETALSRVMRETVTESSLREAIDNGELRLHYQPKLRFDGRSVWSISGGEALVRWHHPQQGILMPDRFIPLAEATDLIGPLTDYVLREALEQSRRWLDQGLDANIAVNVSPQSLDDVDFTDRLSELLSQYGVAGSRLTLEITETAATKNVEAMMDILARLRLKGIRLSIDDFGTGYSSMKQMFRMPFTELKIDRSFVMEIPTSSDARAMVKTMIQLADNLGMTACAEGVESQDVLDFLELAGCHAIQGFFICKPVPAVEFEEFVSSWNSNGGHGLIEIGR
jgi:EAL domain-containing protein (putative c-di-GMP-specific phosphodiesterase class I)/CheY-like chemotaxis protein